MIMELPLYELFIDEEDESGVDFIALVDDPAIKKGWQAFKADVKIIVCKDCGHSWDIKDGGDKPYMCKCGTDNTSEKDMFVSYTDYPEAAKENAKIALRYAEENGWGDCGTDVGKQRANQLAKGEPISRETIARMASFERQRQNSQKELGDGCGRLMWLAWGGDAGVEWAQRKLEQIDKKTEFKFKADKEKRIISGAAMIANLPIYRKRKDGSGYYVMFKAETIKSIVEKFFRNQYSNNFNIMHRKNILAEGVYLIESMIIDSERGIKTPLGFEELSEGSWFISCKVDNDKVWDDYIKTGVFNGFSVEGEFIEKKVSHANKQLDDILEILSKVK
jgi:hypothetical protein